MVLILLGAVVALVLVSRIVPVRAVSPARATVASGPRGRAFDALTVQRARLAGALAAAMVLWVGSLLAFVDWFIAGLPDSELSDGVPSYWSYHRTASLTTGCVLLLASGPVARWVGGRRSFLLLPALPIGLVCFAALPHVLD